MSIEPTSIDLPIAHVTVLEDRAVVRRSGPCSLQAGRQTVVVEAIAPVAQNVSLRAEAEGADVADARIHRWIRVLQADKPEEIASLTQRIRDARRRFEHAQSDQRRAQKRLTSVVEMVQHGLTELPEDAAWGHLDVDTWGPTLDGLFQRTDQLLDTALEANWAQRDIAREGRALEQQLAALDRVEHHHRTEVHLDLVVPTAGDVQITVEYVVPNALWRPLHRAELADGQLTLTSRAAIWQRTGEAWNDVELCLSTAQGSLGSEPPHLTDDRLSARRKPEEVVLQTREVEVQKTGPAATSSSVELPGVDDGGEVQQLQPDGPVTVPVDGRPVFVDLYTTADAAHVRRVCMPELDLAVHLTAQATYTGNRPLLAGPVELVLDNGPIGTTTSMFVAPGAPIELGFGPDDALRVQRSVRVRREHTDSTDGWKHRDTLVGIHLSNFGGEPVRLELTERIPVSEVDHVRIAIDDERTSGSPVLDENGFVRWTLDLDAHATKTLELDWRLSVAPGATLA